MPRSARFSRVPVCLVFTVYNLHPAHRGRMGLGLGLGCAGFGCFRVGIRSYSDDSQFVRGCKKQGASRFRHHGVPM